MFCSKKNMIVRNNEQFEHLITQQCVHKNQTFAAIFGRASKNQVLGSRELNDNISLCDMSLLRDDYYVKQESIFVKPDSFMYEPIAEFILKFHQYGLSQKIERQLTYQNLKSQSNEKVVLTLDILSAGFILWIISVFIAAIVFVVECVIDRFED